MLPDYIFERVTAPRLNAAFENFTLQRGPQMEIIWERYVERWREGRTE